MSSTEARRLLAIRTQLGEGLHWDLRHGCLWMVDILGQRLIRWHIDSPDQVDEWRAPEMIAWVLRRGSELIVGLASGFARAKLDAGTLHPDWLARVHEHRPELRLNDAKLDSSGAIWAGSLNRDDEERPEGRLYRLGPDNSLRCVDEGYAVANGPAIRSDGRLMLHTDSVRRTVYAFDLDVASGSVANKRVWRQFSAEDGHPDGMCFDQDGCVWIAHWGAGCVRRYDSAGRLLRTVAIPAVNVSNVCFFGPDLSRLAVSTARHPPTADHDPGSEAGNLFEIMQPGTRGCEWEQSCTS